MPSHSTQTSNMSQNQKYSGTQTPTEVTNWGDLGNTIRDSILSRLNNQTQAPQEYAATGVGNINNVFNLQKKALESQMAAKGLSGSGIQGSGMTHLAMGEGAAKSNLLNELPLLSRQWQQEDLLNAMKMFALRPTGSTTSGTSDTTGQSETKTSTMDWMKTLMTVGAMAAAPFTGGASMMTLPTASSSTTSPAIFQPQTEDWSKYIVQNPSF